VQELAREHGVAVIAIVVLGDLREYAGMRPDLAAERERLRAYRDRYGVEPA
jgi:orotate phosphoribosyltransferase